jgi:hypothetical protein
MRGVRNLYQNIIVRDKLSERTNQLFGFIAGLSYSKITLLLLAIPLLILISNYNSFPYPTSGSPYSDITISHYPNHIYLRDSLTDFGEIPLWSSTILSGYPFFANPLSGLMYPFGWLGLIIPLPLGFNLLITLHLIWGGLGLYLLLKQEGLSHSSALFAGLLFVLLPKIYSHYGAGHLTLLYAIPWTPWLLWSQRRSQNRNAYIPVPVPPGLILALVFYADVRWGAFAALLWWGYAAAHRNSSWSRLFLGLLNQSLMALLLAAPILVPLAEYALLSTRSSLEAGEILSFSIPISGLFGLLFPNSKGFHEWVLYSGGVVLVLAIAGVWIRERKKNVNFWLAVLILSLFIALGSQIPGFGYLSQLPLVSLLRVPSRSLFITGMCFAVLAGYGLEWIVNRQEGQRSPRGIQLAIFGLLIFSVTIGAVLLIFNRDFAAQILWGVAMLAVGVFWIGVSTYKKIPNSYWIVGLFVIALIDLGVVSINSFRSQSVEQVLSEGESVAAYLSDQDGEFRTYSPSYSIPQQTAVEYQQQLADGVDPLQLSTYAGFMEKASGVPQDSYSVTLPPFESGDPKLDNAQYLPDPEKLGLLNVGYVVAEYELEVDGLYLDAQFDDSRVYKNAYQMPRAWLQKKSADERDESRPAEILDYSSNRILLSAEGPGSLVLSEIDYPGWEVSVDGETAEIHSYQSLLRMVELTPGVHFIEFRFKPRSLWGGIGLFFVGIMILTLNVIYQRKLNKGEGSKPIQNLQL